MANNEMDKMRDKMHEIDRNYVRQATLLEVMADTMKQMADNEKKREAREVKQSQEFSVLLSQVAEMVSTRKTLKDALINNSLKILMACAIAFYVGHHY